jgi:hypothetical protein
LSSLIEAWLADHRPKVPIFVFRDGTLGMTNSKASPRIWPWLVLSLLGPIAAAYCVIDVLIGIENLKRPYWFTHGVELSIAGNALAALPLMLESIRKHLPRYVRIASVAVVLLSGLAYFTFMVLILS